MKKILAVAKWEFLEKIKTKTFIISLIISPIILIGFTIGGTLLSGSENESTKAIGLIDSSGIYFTPMRLKLEDITIQNGQPAYLLINLNEKDESLYELRKKGDEEVYRNRIEGYLLLRNAGTDSVSLEYRSIVSVNFTDARRFEKAFNEVRKKFELSKYNLGSRITDEITKDVAIEHIRINDKGEDSRTNFLFTFFTSIIFIMMLMSMIISSGGMLVRSLVEEKSNRMIDIIVSSCTSKQFLTGKVLGLGGLGLIQLLVWLLIGLAISGYAAVPAQVSESIFLIVIYFILGYVFYTSIFVGLGSIVNTEQEAQQITGYLTMLLIFPIILTLPATQNPHSAVIEFFSYIPLTLPTVMMLRLNIAPVPPVEIISTILIMLASIIITITFSAKIFRIGILSYGKMPSLKELIRWMREEE